MSDLKARLAAAQAGDSPNDRALDVILGQGQHKITKIRLDLLDCWSDNNNENQPYRIYHGNKRIELRNSMEQHGLLNPIIVRPMQNGRYQILSGHNRVDIARNDLHWSTIDTIVLEDISDDEAIHILIDSNEAQREMVLPSERAKAYKIKLEAVSRHYYHSDAPQEKRSDAILGDMLGVGRSTIQRYISLTKLSPELLDIVDGYQYNKGGEWTLIPEKAAIPLVAAELLVGLREKDQQTIVRLFKSKELKKISKRQAEGLRALHLQNVHADISEQDMKSTLGLLGPAKRQSAPVRIKFDLDPVLFNNQDCSAYMDDPELIRRVGVLIADYLKEIGRL